MAKSTLIALGSGLLVLAGLILLKIGNDFKGMIVGFAWAKLRRKNGGPTELETHFDALKNADGLAQRAKVVGRLAFREALIRVAQLAAMTLGLAGAGLLVWGFVFK